MFLATLLSGPVAYLLCPVPHIGLRTVDAATVLPATVLSPTVSSIVVRTVTYLSYSRL